MTTFQNRNPPIRTSLVLLVVLVAAFGCGREPAVNSDESTGGTVPAPVATPLPPDPPNKPQKNEPPAPQGENKNPSFLDAAAKHRGKALSEWITALGDKDDLNRSEAADAVAKYGPNARDAVPALVVLLKDPTDLSFAPALTAIAAIGPAAGGAVEPLIALLKHKDVDVRKSAAGVLADLGPAAGKSVPALIVALSAAQTDTDRDAFRYPVQQLGKHDIRAVFAAVRREALNDVDLGFVIDSLGPGDSQAVAGLIEELKVRDHIIYALNGLKRIGPKAAPALPTVRSLLDDKSPEVRKSAAEVIAAIGPAKPGEGQQPTKEPTKQTEPPEDIRKTLSKAGFDDKADWVYTLAPYVRFGSKQTAEKFTRGDRFDKIEINKAAQDHRDGLRKKSFLVTGLKYRPAVRDDIETRGLVVEFALPMRVRGEKPFDEDGANFAGVLKGMHPSELDATRYSFLTKAGLLQSCTPAEAAVVKKNDGILYHPERGNTTLILVFQDKLDTLKDMARNAKDYSVEIEFSDLCYQRPLAWGYFRQDAYFKADWDCQRLWIEYLLDTKNPQPVYFPTALGKDDEAKIPEIVRANLTALRVVDRNGKVVGSYGAVGGSINPIGGDNTEDKAVAFVKELKGIVTRDEHLPGKPVIRVSLIFSEATDAGLKKLAPLNSLTALSLEHTKVTDAGVKDLATLKNLTTLNLSHTKVTGAGMKELAVLKNLTALNLSKTKVTDAGLKDVATLKTLTELRLSSDQVTDAGVTDIGVKELAVLKNLTTLSLNGAEVTDAGLKELAVLNNLTTLELYGTKVTDAGVKELEKALPKCKIQK